MAVLGDMILTIAKMLSLIIDIYTFIVVIAVIMGWFRPDPYNPIVRMIHQLTDPAFRLARRIIPNALYRTGIDFAPLVVLLLLIFIDSFLIRQLYRFGSSLM